MAFLISLVGYVIWNPAPDWSLYFKMIWLQYQSYSMLAGCEIF